MRSGRAPSYKKIGVSRAQAVDRAEVVSMSGTKRTSRTEAAKSAFNTEQMLTFGRNGIIAHHVRFQLEFIKSVFENVADADDSHKLGALPNR